MDTKSRSSKLFGNTLCILLISLVVALTLCNYGLIRNGMKNQKTTPYEDSSMVNLIGRSSYALYVDLYESRGNEINRPIDVFYNKDVDVNTNRNSDVSEFTISYVKDQALTNLNQELLSWRQDIDGINTNLEYQVYDEQSQTVVLQQLEDESIDFMDASSIPDDYDFYIKLNYNSEGKVEVLSVIGADQEIMKEHLSSYNNDASFLLGHIRYTYYGNYELDDNTNEYYSLSMRDLGLSKQLAKPKDMIVAFGVPKEMNEYGLIYNIKYNHERVTFLNGGFWFLSIMAELVVILLALLLPIKKSWKIGQGLTSKIPLELLILLGFGYCGMALLTMYTCFYTINGFFLKQLLITGMQREVCQFIITSFNVATWAVWLALTFIIILALRQIFVKGIKRYLLENVWIVAILRSSKNGIKKGFNKFLDFLGNFDLSDSSSKKLFSIVIINAIILIILSCFWFIGGIGILIYSIILYFVAKKYMERVKVNYHNLLETTNKMAEGNLDVEVAEQLGIFEPFREELEEIQHGFKKAVQEEVKSQNMKTELITNVSHDLKTPLTAIITYINLLKDSSITEEERTSYINTLELKSLSLKRLIEDLFEISKASSESVEIKREKVDLVALIKQAVFELTDKLETAEIDMRLILPEEKLVLQLDSQKTYRIFENLMINITRYAMPKSRAYLEVIKGDEEVQIVIKNVSAEELAFDSEHITERFVRGDKSRNKEGSGLGLAIVKSFVELQGGSFAVEIDGDLFKAIITFPYHMIKKEEEPEVVQERIEQ